MGWNSNIDTPSIPKIPPTNSTNLDNAHKSTDPTPMDPQDDQIPSEIDETPSEPDEPKHSQKPMERVRDLMSGKAVADYRPKLGWKIATGVQLPTNIVPKPNEAALAVSHHDDEVGKFRLAADFVDEYCMIAEMRESEALEPQNLKEGFYGKRQ